MKKRLNRMLSTLLICSMVMTLMPTTVFATNRKDAVMEEYAGGLCEHHPEHDDECGYSEGIAGTDCSHEHTDDCYTEVVKCTHRHDEDCYPDEIIWMMRPLHPMQTGGNRKIVPICARRTASVLQKTELPA